MDSDAWDDRYRTDELVWKAEPNRFLVDEVKGMTPGRALDLACGEGRNAIWLAGEGWDVTGVDFSAVGLEKARRLAADRGVEVEWVQADVTQWHPPAHAFDLVIVFYLQLGDGRRDAALVHAADAVAPGGILLVVAHHARNIADGYGGPQDPHVLYAPSDVTGLLGADFAVEKALDAERVVVTDEGERVAIDVLVRAYRQT